MQKFSTKTHKRGEFAGNFCNYRDFSAGPPKRGQAIPAQGRRVRHTVAVTVDGVLRVRRSILEILLMEVPRC